MKTFPIYETGRIRAILDRAPVCFAAVVDAEGAPYAFPMMFQDEAVGCSYRMKAESVVVRGTVDFPEALNEKRRCLDVLMKHYTGAAVSYGDPAVRNVVVWRITPTVVSAREYGVPRYGV